MRFSNRWRACVLGLGLVGLGLAGWLGWFSPVLRALVRPLIAEPPAVGFAQTLDAVVVEGWRFVRGELALEVAGRWPGERIYVLLDSYSEPEAMRLQSDRRRARTRARLESAGVAPAALTIIPVDVRGCRPGCTRLYAETVLAALVDSERQIALVTPAFHSERSCRVYRRALEPRGIEVGCYAAAVGPTTKAWFRSLDGMLVTLREFVGYFYYAARGFD